MRRQGWERILVEALAEARTKPFEWGKFDCCLFAADVVRDIDGRDPAAPFRGRYRTAIGAYRALKRYAGGGVAETAAKALAAMGCPEIPRKRAQRGDVVLIDTDLGDALGICIGGKVACAAPSGLSYLPLSAARRAWHI